MWRPHTPRTSADRCRFAEFTCDMDTGELWRDGEPVHLAPQPSKVLTLLLERAGTLVSREELQARVWGEELHVDQQQGLNFCIKQVRQALGDDAEEPRFIATMPRRGYRFVHPVARSVPSPAGRRKGLFPALSSLAVAAALATALLLARAPSPGDEIPLLAVLPFSSADAASRELARGLTDEVTNLLARRFGDRLGVLARTSADRWGDPAPASPLPGDGARVDYLVEGAVHLVGDEPVTKIRLRRARSETLLWTDTLRRSSADEAFEVADAVDGIARAVGLEPAPASRRPPPAALPAAAQEAYFEALAKLSQGTGTDRMEAGAALERVFDLAPAFAPAQVAWARLQMDQAVPGTRSVEAAHRALRRALELDPDDPYALLLLAKLQLYVLHEPDEAGRLYQRALAIAPRLGTAHHLYGFWLSSRGRHAEALAEVGRGLALDPLASEIHSDLAWVHYFAGHRADAVRWARRALALSDRNDEARLALIAAATDLGDEATALAAGRDLMARWIARGAPAPVAPVRGLEGFWRWEVAALEARERVVYLPPVLSAMPLLRLGRSDEALSRLLRSCTERSGWMVPFLDVDPRWDAVRDRPLFLEAQRCLAAGAGAANDGGPEPQTRTALVPRRPR